MRRILFIALLLVFPACSKAGANRTNHCVAGINAQATGAGNAAVCSMINSVSGRKIIVTAMTASATTYTITCTEACTCPGPANVSANFGGFIHNLQICFVDTAASHAQFTVNLTINTSAGARSTFVEAFEYANVPVGFDVAASATSDTVNFVTTGANEFAFAYGSDQAISLAPAGSNTQISQVLFANPGFGYQALDMTQATGVAGTYTANFTEGSSSGVKFVAVIAFGTPTGPPLPTTRITQSCSAIGASSVVGQAQCFLYNTLAGNKIVIGAGGKDTATGTCAVTAESCFCPAGSFANHTYAISFTINACYADQASNHSTNAVSYNASVGTSPVFFANFYEVTGLQAGVDVGSEAAAAATTVNYTTAAPNEWTFTVGIDTASANPMTPGNSFLPLTSITSDPTSGVTPNTQGFSAAKITSGSGSNATSFSLTGSSTPMIATLSFGAGSRVRHRAQVIRYRKAKRSKVLLANARGSEMVGETERK